MVFLPPPPPPNPSQSRLGLVPGWCSGEGEAVSALGASWGSLQRCPSVSAPVWLWVPPLWWHGCKTLWQQMHQNKSIQSHVQYSTLLFSPQPYSLHFFLFLSHNLATSSCFWFNWTKSSALKICHNNMFCIPTNLVLSSHNFLNTLCLCKPAILSLTCTYSFAVYSPYTHTVWTACMCREARKALASPHNCC